MAAPGPTISTKSELDSDEYFQIIDVVGRGQCPPIVRIEDWSPDDSGDQPTPDADRVLIVTIWGGYDKCVHFGKNLGFAVERVRGRWRLVGSGPRFVEYMH